MLNACNAVRYVLTQATVHSLVKRKTTFERRFSFRKSGGFEGMFKLIGSSPSGSTEAAIEQINFKSDRTLDKNQVLRLAECNFIAKKENVLITGSTGIGKSYIASAIGHQACSMGFKVLYEHSGKLFARLKMAKADGSYIKEVARIERQDLLIIDDFGIQPLDAQSRTILMEVIEDRHEKRSTLLTSQVPVNKWFDVIGEQTVADAILDRIIHDAHRLELKGESLRKKKAVSDNLNG
jgi:DNA replication protein DnaC